MNIYEYKSDAYVENPESREWYWDLLVFYKIVLILQFGDRDLNN